MMADTFYGGTERFSGWKCLMCGEIIDPVILSNRLSMRAGEGTDFSKGRHTATKISP